MSKEWQAEVFRNSLARKLEEALKEAGSQNTHSSVELEKQIFSRAKNKEEYLGMVARLILSFKQQGKNIQNLDLNQPPSQLIDNLYSNTQQSPMTPSSNVRNIMQSQPNSMQQQMQQQPNNMQPMQQMRMPMQGSQPQMMMQQQQQPMMQVRARLQQQNQLQKQQQMQQQMQQQQQQQQQQQMYLQRQQQGQTGQRFSQLQQALQQRSQPGVMTPQQGMQRGMVGGMPPHLRAPNPNMAAGSPAQLASQGPSPLPYAHAQSPQNQLGNPSPGGTVPSPLGGGGNQTRPNSLAPSPSSQVNTPLNQPSSQEEKEYLERVKQLEKYIEPLRRLIDRSNDDNEKLAKMKKLLDIMSNPDKRMPLTTLQKCEEVLKRMQLDTTDACHFLEGINTLRQSGRHPNLNHVLSRTFVPPMQTVLGPEISLPPLPDSPPPSQDYLDEDVPDLLQGEIARLDSRFRVWLSSGQPSGGVGGVQASATSIELVCQLDDRDLPAVPQLVVSVPQNYPDQPPDATVSLMNRDYRETPFLSEVADSFLSRLAKMPNQFTLSQLLTAWELSVRSACVPVQFKHFSTTEPVLGV